MKGPDPKSQPTVYGSLQALSFEAGGQKKDAPRSGSPVGQGTRAAGRGPGQHPEPCLPSGYLSAGYMDKKGHLLETIFLPWPEELTAALTDRHLKVRATKNSLRAFYSMLRMAKKQFDAQRADKDKALGDATTQLYKMQVGAVYQSERGVISPLCKDFLFKNIDTVLQHKSDFDEFARNLNAFVEHFQAVIAYLPEKPER